jgi:anti-sigma B factor antagonist
MEELHQPLNEIHAAFIHASSDFSNLVTMHDAPLLYTITAATREGTVVIKLSGPLTLGNMFELQAELRAITPAVAIFDLTDCEYMDSAGLGVLINFYVSAEKHGRKMALSGVSSRIEALLDLTHVKTLLKVFPTVAEAEAAA